jgi:exonuclease I
LQLSVIRGASNKKTGKEINFTDEKGRVFSDTLDKDRVPDNIYELVNEIMEDLKFSFEDIDIIELFHKRCRHFYRTLTFKSQPGCLIIRDWETKEWKRCRY